MDGSKDPLLETHFLGPRRQSDFVRFLVSARGDVVTVNMTTAEKFI